MSNRKTNANRKNNRASRRKQSSNKISGEYRGVGTQNKLLVVPPSLGNFGFPDRYRTRLRFCKGTFISLSSVAFGSVRFRPSSAYDVDPTIASAAIPGYQELANVYASYRVLSSSIKVEAANPSNAVMPKITVAPTNQDPGVSPTANYVNALSQQPYARYQNIGLVGSPRAIVKNKMTTERIFGSKAALFDDAFASVTNSVPVNNWWWVIGVNAASVIALNIYIDVEIDIWVEFFNRFALQS